MSKDAVNPEQLVFSREAARAVDRTAIDEYHMAGLVLMENAARSVSEIICELYSPGDVAIVCGGGNNGGDGFAIARHLSNAGYRPRILTINDPDEESDAGRNRKITRAIGIELVDFDDSLDLLGFLESCDLIVDAIFGTGLDREVSSTPAQVIHEINDALPDKVAVDVPSGLDCNTGEPLGTAVLADVTATFCGIKQGFFNPDSQPFVGNIFIADIGVPMQLLRRFGMPVPNTEGR